MSDGEKPRPAVSNCNVWPLMGHTPSCPVALAELLAIVDDGGAVETIIGGPVAEDPVKFTIECPECHLRWTDSARRVSHTLSCVWGGKMLGDMERCYGCKYEGHLGSDFFVRGS